MVNIVPVQPTARGLALLDVFYSDFYVAEFPDPNERKSLENMKMCLHKREEGWYGTDNYHIRIATDEHAKPIGGVVADFFAAPAGG